MSLMRILMWVILHNLLWLHIVHQVLVAGNSKRHQHLYLKLSRHLGNTPIFSANEGDFHTWALSTWTSTSTGKPRGEHKRPPHLSFNFLWQSAFWGLHVALWWTKIGFGAESKLASMESIQEGHGGFTTYSININGAPVSGGMEPFIRLLFQLMEHLKRCSVVLGVA